MAELGEEQDYYRAYDEGYKACRERVLEQLDEALNRASGRKPPPVATKVQRAVWQATCDLLSGMRMVVRGL